MRLPFVTLLLIVLAAGADLGAQTVDIFDPDDYVDPRSHGVGNGSRGDLFFVSRAVVGFARGYADKDRPLNQDVAVANINTSVYWSSFQLTYKHSEVRGENAWSARRQPAAGLQLLAGNAPPPGPKDSVQLALYHQIGGCMLRYQGSWGRQSVAPPRSQQQTPDPGGSNVTPSGYLDGTVGLRDGGPVAPRDDEDEHYAIDIDTVVHIGGRSFYGAVSYSSVTRNTVRQKETQQQLTYTGRLPILQWGELQLAPAVLVGGISGGNSALSLANPTLDLSWHSVATRANVHVVYSPVLRNGARGWDTQHQVAVYVDRALYAKLVRLR
ncbi:MAG: hypothetical protein JWN02_288 [Acidobacteria bacterium]|nr:hypothetical protein [Acidobacteriota bacterium]